MVGTRDIVSRLPRWMWMKADDVVAFSLEQLADPRAPVMVVPGRANRLIAMLARKLPYRTAFGLVARRSGDFRRQDQ